MDVVYDVVGREWKTSNPYVSQGESTYGVVEARFDGLGRIKTVINQDLTSAQTEYAGNSVRTTDETGKQHISQADALGRLMRVCEVTAGNTRSPSESCGMTGFGGGTGYLTTYSYSQDSNENVTQISQGGQTRILRADKAGRQKSSKIIEVSTSTEVTYAYDNDGNHTSVTDQRGTVCFEYDALHRMKRKRHPTGAQNCTNGNIAAEFAYDGTQANNAIGRLITEWDGTAGSSDKNDYTYDMLGRVITANRTVSSTVYAMGYTYDLAGNLTSISYPSSSGTRRKVDYLYNANAELNIVRDTTGTAFDYVTATTYSNLGPMQRADLGNGVRTTLSWNKNGEMTSLVTQKVGGTTHLSLGYTYFDNGQIQEISNGLTNLKSEKYTYDQLRRLFTAQRGPDTSIQRKYSYDYDRYGNRWAQTVVAGSGLGGTLDFYSATNRVATTGFSYANGGGQDQAGNLTANGPGSSYTYNMENFMTAAGSTTYTYDAQGRRVRKTVGGTVTDYFYSASELIAEKTGTAWTDYIFFGDQRIAQLDIGSIAVRFTNDSCSACSGPPVGGGDRNLFINSITIGTTTILPNDPSVSYTGAPCNGPGGMYCSGDMITSAVPSGQTITVNAYGSPDYNIYPHMQVWVNGKLMGEWDVTGTAQNYTATLVRYYSVDHLGSTRLYTDASGNSLGTCDYEPFGEIQPGTTCSVPTNFRFAGMEWDANAGPNGLYHTWFRQYDPDQGRWMAVDPLAGHDGDPQSWDRYLYVRNDPVNLVDPFGLDFAICDGTGNCGEISDADFADFQRTSPNLVFIGSAIFVRAANGNLTRIGFFFYVDRSFDLLKFSSDFFAGVGDSLTFGITAGIRNRLGINVVDTCSTAYAAGEWTEFGVELALTGGSAALKGLAKNARVKLLGQQPGERPRNLASAEPKGRFCITGIHYSVAPAVHQRPFPQVGCPHRSTAANGTWRPLLKRVILQRTGR